MSERRYFVVGTAGHIDHGKTALVEALTGKNTDRLKEERERGISIDIDFAPFELEDGRKVGIVDVPGHERFVRNMVAGAAGVDAAMLVIDVGEGIKPQTLEHMAILEMFGVRDGVVVLTKVDLVDDEWVAFAEDAIREELQPTVFAHAPIIATSVRTGQGLSLVREWLSTRAREAARKDDSGAFRLPVDKVFTVPGFGTVVSGTVWRGRVSVGDTLECLPGRIPARVRGIQVHGQATDCAVAGQRAALNVTGLDRNHVFRGAVMCAPGTLQTTRLFDARVQRLKGDGRALYHRERVHFHLGTAETMGRVLLLEDEALMPGQSGLAQILLDKPISCEASDDFVIRGFSPLTTIGGGHVLHETPLRLHRRKREHIIQRLQALDADSPAERMLALSRQGQGLTVARVMTHLGVTEDEADAFLAGAVSQGNLVRLPGGWLSTEVVEQTLKDMVDTLLSIHKRHRYVPVAPKVEFTKAFSRDLSSRDVDFLIELGADRGLWELNQATIRAMNWEVTLTAEETGILEELVQLLRSAGIGGMAEAELCGRFPKRDRIAKNLLQYAKTTGDVVEVAPGTLIHRAVLQSFTDCIEQIYLQSGPFGVGQVRDATGTSRKNALLMLEYLDAQGVTRREGDVRHIVRAAFY